MQRIMSKHKEQGGYWLASVLCLGFVAALFWLTWKSQFAAPPGYLFETPSEEVEAGYCLAVAQDIVPGGAPFGSYFDEAARFWVARLRGYGGNFGASLATGRAALGGDLLAHGGSDLAWMRDAMEMCSRRAINYGARFREFD